MVEGSGKGVGGGHRGEAIKSVPYWNTTMSPSSSSPDPDCAVRVVLLDLSWD